MNYEHKALLIAEHYGVIEYKVQGNKMVYFANYPLEHNTVKVTINLDSKKEHRERLSKYYKKGNLNIGL